MGRPTTSARAVSSRPLPFFFLSNSMDDHPPPPPGPPASPHQARTLVDAARQHLENGNPVAALNVREEKEKARRFAPRPTTDPNDSS